MADEMADRLRNAMRASAEGVEGRPGAADDVRRRARRQDVTRRVTTSAAVLALLAVGATAALAGLPGGSEPDVILEPGPTPQTPSPSPDASPGDGDDAGLDMATCTDPVGGFAIGYPADWHHTSLTDGSECRLFDPEPLELPEVANDDVTAAVILDHVSADYDRHLELSEGGGPGSEILDEEHTTLDGRRARRRELVSTGEAMYPEGVRTLSWTIDLDGETLVISSADHHVDGDFDEHAEIVDAMAASIERVDADTGDDDAPDPEAGEGSCSAAGADTDLVPEAPDLPGAVVDTRAAILEAAAACDVDRLAELASADQFTFTFGGATDPAAHWRDGEDTGEAPLRHLVEVLDTEPATEQLDGETRYVWPAAHAAESWDAVTAEEREAVAEIYDDEQLAMFDRAGAYLGHRVIIDADGEWTVFVRGD